MNQHIGKTCPFCQTLFNIDDDVTICDKCDMPHHTECWHENGGCTVYGCTGRSVIDSSHAEYQHSGPRFMGIPGTEGLSWQQIMVEIQLGARFVIYQYCVSIFIMTFLRGSGVHFIRSGESAVGRGFVYTFISLLFGWWGIPWGPIYTLSSIIHNLTGGKDITQEFLYLIENPSVLDSDQDESMTEPYRQHEPKFWGDQFRNDG